MKAPVDWIDVDGGRLYAASSGSGPVILLIHGWSLDHRSFSPQIEALSASHRVICFDRRGFGRSDAPPDMHRELDDIDRLLDACGVDSAHIIGVSQGGRIALRYAVTRPARIRSLILQGAMVDGLVIHDTGADAIPIDEYIELARSGQLEELRRRWLSHPMMSPATDDVAATRLLTTIVSDYEARDLIAFDSAAYAFDVDPLDVLPALSFPILLMTGDQETAARKAHARAVLTHARDAREITVSNSGHLANVEQSAFFNDAVLSFVDAADGRRSSAREGADGMREGREPA